MSLLEIIGCIFIVLYFFERHRLSVLRRLTVDPKVHDPEYPKRDFEFERMKTAFDNLYELRDKKFETSRDSINDVKGLLDSVISYSVPMPKDSFASDYRSRFVDYRAIGILAVAMLNSESTGEPIVVEALDR